MRAWISRGCVLLALIAATVLIAVLPSLTAQDKDKAPRVKWEYKSASTPEQVDVLGNHGWELVAVTGGHPYIESSRTNPVTSPPNPANVMTQNTVRHAPLVYHLKRQK